MGKNISLDEGTKTLIKKKADTLGLSFSAFVRLAAITYEVKRDPSVRQDTRAPEPHEGDSNDQ